MATKATKIKGKNVFVGLHSTPIGTIIHRSDIGLTKNKPEYIFKDDTHVVYEK